MSVLGKVTDEYFGKTEREEDLMRPPRIDPKHSTRPLTPNEHLFLSLLATGPSFSRSTTCGVIPSWCLAVRETYALSFPIPMS